MRKYSSFLVLWGVAFLAGCSMTPVQEPSTPKAPEPLTQSFDCKGKEYYTNLTWSGNFTLQRNEAESGFSAVIPELCVKLIAHMPAGATEYFTGGIEQWKNYYLENEKRFQLFSGHWINNHIIIGGNGYSNYIFKDKESDLTIQEAINYDYGLWDFDEAQPPTYLFGKAICNVVPKTWAYREERGSAGTPRVAGDDENVRYAILTPQVIADQHWEVDLDIYSPICWYSYPAQNLGFFQTRTYDILYSKKHPTKYVLYNSYLWDDDSNPLLNMTIAYLD